jgi:hypothetical protein
MTDDQAPTSVDAGLVEPSRLKRLIDVWERLGSWNEQELFLQFGDDLCSLGRYITAQTFHERVYSPNGPDARVLVPSGEPFPLGDDETMRDVSNVAAWAKAHFIEDGYYRDGSDVGIALHKAILRIESALTNGADDAQG